MKPLLLIVLLAILAVPLRAEDWQTSDGTRYVNVRVVRVEDDAITIIYRDGGALVPLFKLPAALQQKFDYDPVKAKIAAQSRLRADKENAEALQREEEQTAALKRQQQIRNASALSSTNALAH